jgi:hypothetical protein
MLRRSLVRRSLQTSNIVAHPQTGRWFNPPHQWMAPDMFFLGGCIFFVASFIVNTFIMTQSSYSPHMAKNYYPKSAYTKEFIEKYDRTNRWRWY